MKIWLNRHGLYVWLFRPTPERGHALGFVFKWRRRQQLISERSGGWCHSLRLGPLFVRGYARRRFF